MSDKYFYNIKQNMSVTMMQKAELLYHLSRVGYYPFLQKRNDKKEKKTIFIHT